MPIQKITPFLWYDNQAEEAAEFYASLFEGSRIHRVARYGEAGPGPAGSVMTVDFELAGVRFTALNGGPHFKFTEAISLVVNCESQKEIDRLWESLSEGGQTSQCGWLKDRYGLSWQIVPTMLGDLACDPDAERVSRMMQAMLQMTKLEVDKLQRAFYGK